MTNVKPNLSEQVMIEAIHKKNDLHSVLFAQILASNPQAAKSADVKERMEHKLLPFDEYQKAEIMEGLEWVSQKEMLEAEMTMILQERTLSLLTIAKEIAADENITDKSSAYLAVLHPDLFLDDAIAKAEIQLSTGDYDDALTTLNNVITSFELKPDAHQELIDWIDVLETKYLLETNEATTLSMEQFNTLAHVFFEPGSYTITAYGHYCAMTVDSTFTIEILDCMGNIETPELNIFATAESLNEFDWQFIAMTENVENVTWDFGDGSFDNGNEVLHSFSDTGLYVVTYCAQYCDSIVCDSLTVEIMVGLAELSHREIRIFPNPFSDYLHIVLPQEANTVEVHNNLGALLQMHSAQREMDLDLSNLSQGVYLLRIMDRNNQVLWFESAVKD